MAPPTSTVQDYIASLAGRYEELQDLQVVSGEASRRFNNYVYSRKLLIASLLMMIQIYFRSFIMSEILNLL